MNKKHYDVKIVKEQATGRWDSILSALVPDLKDALDKPGRHVDCPIHGGKNDFRLWKDYAQTGAAICTCGKYTDGFALIMGITGCSLDEAVQDVADYLGLNDEGVSTKRIRQVPVVRITPEQRLRLDDSTRRQLQNAWQFALNADHPEYEYLQRYLMARGLAGALGSLVLRYNPECKYYDEEQRKVIGKYPCMLSLISDAAGKPISVHRTYITLDGKKADVPRPKKMMPYASNREFAGSAIRLFPATTVLGLTEGVETALAVRQATGMPVWACMGNRILESVAVPSTVRLVVIWADKDRSMAGQKSAEVLAKRLREEGFQVVIMLPPGDIGDAKGLDWLDVFNREGTAPFFQESLSIEDSNEPVIPSCNIEVTHYVQA